MNFICENKNQIIKQLNIFKNVKIRHLMKSTSIYAYMLEFGSHPNYTTDMLKMEKLMENSWHHPYKDKRIVKYEIEDMLFDDIPIFFGETNSRNIYTSEGICISNYFNHNALELSKDRIMSLNQKEIKRQLSFIISSLGQYNNYSKKRIDDAYDTVRFNSNIKYLNNHKQKDILDLVMKISNNILETSIEKENNVSWLTHKVIDDHYGQFFPIELCSDSSLLGILLFYYYLSKTTKDKHGFEIYHNIFNSIKKVPKYLNDGKKISAYEGLGSILYPLLLINNDNPNEECRDLIHRIILWVDAQCSLENNQQHPFYLSSMLIIIVRAYEILNNFNYLLIAEKVGNKILESINHVGISNLSSKFTNISLIALSLAILSEYVGDSKFIESCELLLKAERSILFSENFDKTPVDKLKLNTSDIYDLSTIGSHRIRLSKLVKDPLFDKEIELIFNNLKKNTSKMHCLENGIMGEVDFLINYYNATSNKNVLQLMHDKIFKISTFNNIANTFAVDGIDQYISINLLSGISGIGYGILRLNNKKSVPSISFFDII